MKFKYLFGATLLFLALLAFTPGCKSTLAPAGVYQGDRILYEAEKAITTSYRTFDSFLQWELFYRASLPVEVSKVADVIRLNAKKWIDSAGVLRDAYIANPTSGNRDKLSVSLSLIDAALAESSKYMTMNKNLIPPQ